MTNYFRDQHYHYPAERDYHHARPSDPETSHEAVPHNITEQCYRVLRAYRNGQALLDHDAYRLVGLDVEFNGARQRCTDLRHALMIERTGDRGRTPSGKAGYLCRITQAGLDYLRSKETT
jgi:hypothetical protein